MCSSDLTPCPPNGGPSQGRRKMSDCSHPVRWTQARRIPPRRRPPPDHAGPRPCTGPGPETAPSATAATMVGARRHRANTWLSPVIVPWVRVSSQGNGDVDETPRGRQGESTRGGGHPPVERGSGPIAPMVRVWRDICGGAGRASRGGSGAGQDLPAAAVRQTDVLGGAGSQPLSLARQCVGRLGSMGLCRFVR